MQTSSDFITHLNGDVFVRLRKGLEELSSKQQTVCSYILENYQQVAFYTVEELAVACGTSPATIVRTVKSLGYSGYHELLSEFQKLLLSSNSSLWWEMEQSWTNDVSELPLPLVIKDNIETLQNALTPDILERFSKGAEMLENAQKINIIAVRSSRGAAQFFYSLLSQFMSNVSMIEHGADELYDKLVDYGEKDILFVISLGGPHYASTSVEAVNYASENKIPSILLTNDHSSPAYPNATLSICVPQTQKHYSLVPVLTVLEAFVLELGIRKKESAKKKLRKLEKVLTKQKRTY